MSVTDFTTQSEEPISHARKGNAVLPAIPLRVLIVGADRVGCAVAAKLMSDENYHVIGFVNNGNHAINNTELPILGSQHDVMALIEKHKIDEVIIAHAPTWQEELVESLIRDHSRVKIRAVLSYYDALLNTGEIQSVGDIAVVNVSFRDGTLFDYTKRIFDIFFSFLGIILLSPIILIVSSLVKLSSRGPVFFQQERIGQFGKPFILLKFRTMCEDAEMRTGPVLSGGKNDQRLTPIGRWLRLVRLDEVPQLINVLRGEMSLIGPRPERPIFVEQFIDRDPLYLERHRVRPGITGLAQIYGGYYTDARDKLRFDLFYVSHRNLWLDIMILVQTVLRVVFRPNGY